MAALSKDQLALLYWLGKTGNSISVCIELCPDIGKIIRGERPSTNDQKTVEAFQRRTLFKLKACGFIKEDIHYITGIRYLICTINQRGIEKLKQIDVQLQGELNHA
ncbi:hypothetical protein G3R49_06330 [Shewanella sp. WXL01]|uniref:hypothetical protein n=1 Tax=Shewanella sp. WXL01 TaxID=2709721 RepID=UPI00143835D1|nr:hypothetical protein [Shewanella sp. WXL01]NKF50187.1 hypothetical protein [Shewanella sp. WXL01]